MLKKIALILMLIAPMSVFAQKFGHIKTQEIITVMPEYTKAQTDIETMRKQFEDEMKRYENEFTKKYTEFQQEQANLPKNILERRQKDLQDLHEKGQQMAQDSQMQLQQSWMQMLEPIAKKIDDAIKASANSNFFILFKFLCEHYLTSGHRDSLSGLSGLLDRVKYSFRYVLRAATLVHRHLIEVELLHILYCLSSRDLACCEVLYEESVLRIAPERSVVEVARAD